MSKNFTPSNRFRRGRKARSKERTIGSWSQVSPASRGILSGRYAPLSCEEMSRIDAAVRRILLTVGMAEAPQVVIEHLVRRGGRINDNGRLLFSERLIDEALAGLNKNFTLAGQLPRHDMLLQSKRVYLGSGGAAPNIVDLDTGHYRASTLADLHSAARLVDNLENIHFFSRPLVANDLADEFCFDINTAYASLVGTSKHVLTSASVARHVQEIAQICYFLAGSKTAFVARPFMSFSINHVVPPLRYAADACEVMAQAVRLGFPVHANSFGQLGASSPVTIAGAVAQNVAETLAGMIFAWCIDESAKVTFGTRPMITDLRTGALSGGSGEQALLMAACVQMAQFYGLPNTSIAGATDSKIADAQSGYEKCLSVTLAAHTGSNMVTQACGMLASLSACALESYVIDNDMLGSVMRSISPVEVSDDTLAVDVIASVVEGDGHFLGHKETLRRMESDFLYPMVADRGSLEDWEANGSHDIRYQAREFAKEILTEHYPTHIDDEIDAKIRSDFDIRLPKQLMKPK